MDLSRKSRSRRHRRRRGCNRTHSVVNVCTDRILQAEPWGVSATDADTGVGLLAICAELGSRERERQATAACDPVISSGSECLIDNEISFCRLTVQLPSPKRHAAAAPNELQASTVSPEYACAARQENDCTRRSRCCCFSFCFCEFHWDSHLTSMSNENVGRLEDGRRAGSSFLRRLAQTSAMHKDHLAARKTTPLSLFLSLALLPP